jgi:hypothetical protein
MRLALALALLGLAACSTHSSNGPAGPPGSDGQPCIDDNTCNPGLVCIATSTATGPSAWTCESSVACPPIYFDASSQTWAATSAACDNGMAQGTYEGTCGPFLTTSECGVDTCGISLFDADSGALVATLGTGNANLCIAGDTMIPASCFLGSGNATKCAAPDGGSDAGGDE